MNKRQTKKKMKKMYADKCIMIKLCNRDRGHRIPKIRATVLSRNIVPNTITDKGQIGSTLINVDKSAFAWNGLFDTMDKLDMTIVI